MPKLSNALISIFRKGEKRISSEQFEQAVNEVLLSDTVADATKKPILTPDDKLFYRLSNGELLPAYDVIHLKGLSTNGYKGKSPIQVHRENLSMTQSAKDYGKKFCTQGGKLH